LPQCVIVTAGQDSSFRASGKPDQPASAAFTQPMRLDRRVRRSPFALRRYEFFESKSFSITLSTVRSATIRFSFAFSSSTRFSRRASLTSSPAVFRLSLVKGRFGDPLLPAEVGRFHPCLRLLQNPDGLFLRKSTRFHKRPRCGSTAGKLYL
jgi:hypothetical protein